MKYDVVIIGGGFAGLSAAEKLSSAGKRCLVVQAGISSEPGAVPPFDSARNPSKATAYTLLRSDRVLRGEFTGARLIRVFTEKLGSTPLEADNFILATGKFFSRGLVSTMDGIYEPVFGCDVEYLPDRSLWLNPDFFSDQPFERFGLPTDDNGRVRIGGVFIENLYAAGGILAGITDTEKSVERVCRNLI